MRDNSVSSKSLGGSGVSQSASSRLLELLEPLSRVRKVHKGQNLFVKGDEADALYVLSEGLMEISTLSEDGRRLAHIIIRPGAIVGEMALLDGDTRSATVSARTDATVWKVDGPALFKEMKASPDLAIELLKLTVGRLRWMGAQLEDQAFQSVEIRLARRVSFLLQTMGNEGVLHISQSDLAEHVGATREAVSKVLSEWKDDHVIEIGRGKLKLVDADALFQIATFGDI